MQPSGDHDRPVRRSAGAARARALLCGLGAGLLGLAVLTACTPTSEADDPTTDATSADGANTVMSAPPGKYQELPQPCGTVAKNTLTKLLPGSDDYAGQAALTYDTDRRVGCRWSTTDIGNEGGSRFLTIDLERVVSYDPTVSDESQAEEEYNAKAVAAGIPSAVTSSSTSPAAAAGSGTTPPPGVTASPTTSASPSPDADTSASATAGSRALTDLGDNAFLDDEVTTRDAGVHRDITIVFREANVLITIEYSQSSADKTIIPASAAVQDGVQRVASEIAHQFD